jgi:hypothetical protein
MMEAKAQSFITQRELARRWGKSEAVISLASAIGAGPRYVKLDGQIVYTQDEIQRYERACLFFDPAEVALHDLH